MKKKFQIPLILLPVASVALALIFAVLRSVLTVTLLDTHYGVYENGSVLPTLYHWILAFTLIGLAIFVIVAVPHRDNGCEHKDSELTMFASCVCAFILVANVAAAIYNMVGNYAPPTVFDILELCFTPFALVYFIKLIFSQKEQSAPLALMAIFVVAWCSVCLIRTYFDNSVLQVSPNKIITEFGFLSAMIYFLSEVRAQLGILNHKLYVTSAITAPILLFVSAAPNLLFPSELSIGESDSFTRYAVCAALAIFIWARLYAYCKKSPKAE